MTATVRDAGPYEKFVGFSVSEAELEDAKTRAARRLSREIKLKGFRPGKAPRPVVEAAVGSARLRSEAIEEILPEKLADVLRDIDLAPAVNPQLEDITDTDDGVDVEVRVTLWPRLDEVPEYHDRRIEVGSPVVTDDEVSDQLDRIRDQFARVEPVNRSAQDGDYVTIDIRADSNGDPVEDAMASGLMYEVGSAGFVDGIDEALQGASEGELITFAGTLPEGFGERAGEDVEYTVTATAIQEKVLPELTDEWVSEVSEFETVEEMRADLVRQMTDMKKRSHATRFRDLALEGLVEQVGVDLPDALVRAEMDELFHRFAHRLEEQEITLDDYFGTTGITQEAFLADLRSQAEHSLKTRLLLEAVIDQEDLGLDDHEVESFVERVAQGTSDPAAIRSAFADPSREQSLRGDMLRSKALDLIVSAATPVDESGEPVDLTVEEPAGDPVSEVGAEVEAEIIEGITEGVVDAEVVAEPVEG